MYELHAPHTGPLWLKAGVCVTAASTFSMAVCLAVFVATAVPAIRNLAENTDEVLTGLDAEELNTAVLRLVKILDLACESFISCD